MKEEIFSKHKDCLNIIHLMNIYKDEFQYYIKNTKNIIILLTDENFVIKQYNHGFVKLLDLRSFDGQIKECSIDKFLIPESYAFLKFQENKEVKLKKNDEKEECKGREEKQINNFINAKLNFTVSKTANMSMLCHIFRIDNYYLIIGDNIVLAENHFLDKLSQMNNEMANMVREINRKNRELESKNIELKNKNIELQAAYSKIKTLSGIIPICMHCKKIRDDEGYWKKVEEYISQHSEVQFSHGICPKCMKKYYPEYL